MQRCFAGKCSVTPSVPLLVVVAGLLLLVGVLGVAAIALVACIGKHNRTMQGLDLPTDDDQLNAWDETGKRHNEDFPEQ